MKKYRYFKITPNDEKDIKKLSKTHTNLEIAKIFNVSDMTIRYHLFSKKKKKETIKKNGIGQKRRLKQGRIKKIPKEYITNYINNRLKTDEEFNKRFKKNIEKSRIKRVKKRKKLGLCYLCGGKRNNKKWKLCEYCRNKRREEAKKNKKRKI
jgi:hypothetical protein